MRFYLRAVSYFRRDWRLIALLLGLIALSILVGLLQVWPMAILVDTVLAAEPHRDWVRSLFLDHLPHSKPGQVVGLALIGLGLTACQELVMMLRQVLNARIKFHGVARLRRELFDKLQELDPTYHRARPQGDSIYRVTLDTLGCFGILDTFIGASVAAVYLASMTGTMLTQNVWVTVFALSLVPLMVAVNVWFGRTIKRRSAESKQVEADFTTFVQRAVSTVLLIQSFGRQRESATRFGGAVDRCTGAWMRLTWQEQLYPLAVNVIYALGVAIIFGYGGYLVWRDQMSDPAGPVASGLTVGGLLAIMGYFGKFWDPLRTLTGFRATIQTHVAATERVFDVLDRRSAVADPPGAPELPVRPRTLTLDRVRFGYREDAPVLRGVSAEIRPGQMVAFVGPSGTGKSTLLSLFSRFYNPTAGAIRLDGHDLRDLRAADVRKHLAFVPQESPMLAASIAENIAFGRPEASEAEIRRAAQLAGAAEFVERLPDGYATQLVEAGCNLSGGQRQRIAIARALLTDAPVLVLDEPTSALDPRQERMVMAALVGLKSDRTVILVTHRLDTLKACDQIFVMDKGRVIQRGSHEELMNEEGFYRSNLTMHAATEVNDVDEVAA